jgi:hypothetical protein
VRLGGRLACGLAIAIAIAGAPAPARAASAGAAARAVAVAAPPASAASGDPAARARAQAREVLAQRRFRATELPSPLRSVRERVGSALRAAGGPFDAAFGWVASWLPGGPPVLLALLAGAILTAAALLAARVAARRAGLSPAGADGTGGSRERVSAARLRQEAERAERRGDLDAALRLRFRAGLVELEGRELIALRPALTNHELLRAVPSPTLAGLVDGFEAVAYGGRPAMPDDLEEARAGWPRVPDEVPAP